MQSKKASNKTPKVAKSKATPQVERAATADVPAPPRSSRVASAKRNAAADMTSGKHHHKASKATLPEVAITKEAAAEVPAKPEKAMAVGAVNYEQVAKLAHSYWAARGYDHGSHEDDWFRAEQELKMSRS